MISQIRWIDRKFDFSFPVTIFPSLYERLDGMPIRVKTLLANYPDSVYGEKLDDKWSLKERVGHIIDVEELWTNRLKQFLSNEETLIAADMSNQKTEQANHNSIEMNRLIELLFNTRSEFLKKIKDLSEEQLALTSLHPRLKTPMRLVDMLYFVAEHDDNEIALMRQVGDTLIL